MRTDHEPAERRREPRYPIEAKVRVWKRSGEMVCATAVDISSSGMRLRPCQACTLELDEEVSIQIELPESVDKPFSSWGLGRVVYINERGIGIQLFGGRFDPLPAGEVEG